MKDLYITAMRIVRSILSKLGILQLLEKHRNKRWVLYIRSLFAIYDLDDMIGLDLPWWNFNATAEIEKFLRGRDATVFEYGSGASTFWLSSRAKAIISVEFDKSWYDKLLTYSSHLNNVELKYIPAEQIDENNEDDKKYCSEKKNFQGLQYKKYVEFIKATDQKYDLIVIDGRCRTQCLAAAIDHLKPNGIILFDDTLRERYRDGIAEHPCLIATRHYGLTAALPYFNETTLLKHPEQRTGER